MSGRTCGECTACCKAMSVKELGKAAGKPCVFLKGGKCSIYASRPGSCRAFECLWLQDDRGIWTGTHRPDRLGIILSIMYGTAFGDVLAAFEVWPGASDEDGPRKMLKRLSKEQIVIVMKGNDRKILAPPEREAEVRKIVAEKTKWSNSP